MANATRSTLMAEERPFKTAPDHAPPELERWIDQGREARIIVTADGELVWASAAARALLAESGPFHIHKGRLAGARGSVGEILPRVLATADVRPRCWMLEERDDTWLLWAQRIPSHDEACIGLVIRRRGEPVAFTALAEARHLTPAEARIVSMMLAGVETARIAEALDISVETLRTHVKHAYRKLGVTSRGELFVGALFFLEP